VAYDQFGDIVTSITFASPLSQAEPLTLFQNGYQASFSASSTNPLVATGAVYLGSSGDYVVNVTPMGQGTCTIQFSSNNGGAGSVSVTVTSP
jgi:hypothetical protein